jgi:hypothetical protein
MSNFYRVLQDNFSIFQESFPDAKMGDVEGVDIFYTEGMAKDAKFKIMVSQENIYLSTIYVKDDGEWFMTMDSVVIKKAMRTWVFKVHMLSDNVRQ